MRNTVQQVFFSHTTKDPQNCPQELPHPHPTAPSSCSWQCGRQRAPSPFLAQLFWPSSSGSSLSTSCSPPPPIPVPILSSLVQAPPPTHELFSLKHQFTPAACSSPTPSRPRRAPHPGLQIALFLHHEAQSPEPPSSAISFQP